MPLFKDLSDVDAAHEVCIVVAAGQITDDDTAAAGRRRMNVLTVADVDTHVGTCLACIAAGIIEEYQIAGLQVGNGVYPGARPLCHWPVAVWGRE